MFINFMKINQQFCVDLSHSCSQNFDNDIKENELSIFMNSLETWSICINSWRIQRTNEGITLWWDGYITIE